MRDERHMSNEDTGVTADNGQESNVVEHKRPGPKTSVPRETRFCHKEQKHTEWRRYKLRKDKDGNDQYQWRCHSCQKNADNASKERRRKNDLISVGKIKTEDVVAPKVKRDMPLVREAWNQWCSGTGRKDEGHVNLDFAEAYSDQLRVHGPDRDLSHRHLLYLVHLATFLPPKPRDSHDVKRVVDVLTEDKWEQEARKRSARGEDVVDASEIRYKYIGSNAVVDRVLKDTA